MRAAVATHRRCRAGRRSAHVSIGVHAISAADFLPVAATERDIACADLRWQICAVTNGRAAVGELVGADAHVES